MTEKHIKNEPWTVKHLISKINNQEIIKPKFQRKKKWDREHISGKESTPNEYSYINFLYETKNSVHPITLGLQSNEKGVFYTNIDGNNRINAINHFIEKPFEIFNDLLKDLNKFIDNSCPECNDHTLLKNIFCKLSYDDIINFRYNHYFNDNGYQDLYQSIQKYRDDFEPYIDDINKKLYLNKEKDRFDNNVIVIVNIFEGYSLDELCKIFESINKYNSILTEDELLASQLYNIDDFIIDDKPFETELKVELKKIYEEKSKEEILNCFKFNDENHINAYDFITGFQQLSYKKYKFINISSIDGYSLFFKLWRLIYNDFKGTFITNNVNEFIEKVNNSCDILQDTISDIFTNKINDKLFNNSCQDKLSSLKKNNLIMLISSILGFLKKGFRKSIIKKEIEKCLVLHFFINDLKNKDTKDKFRSIDSISYRAGGRFIDNISKNMLSTPELISNKITKDLFYEILTDLSIEVNKPYERKQANGANKNDKRRKNKFWEKTIWFYYYKQNIPVNMLENEFSIEHIIPNSSEWVGNLDKDRPGNLIPIISNLNSQRGNKHISFYKKDKEHEQFSSYIKDIIPNDKEYDDIIKHEKNKLPQIIDNDKYNKMCDENEEKYFKNIMNCLFTP